TNDSVTLIRNSTISVNSARSDGGGITVGPNGRLTLEGRTVSGNQDSAADGPGGGVSFPDGPQTVTDSTVSANAAGSGGGGGYVGGGSLPIRNSTVAFNTADADNAGGGKGGGLFAFAGSVVTLLSTIVADNAAGATGLDPDISGNVTAAFSLVENVT